MSAIQDVKMKNIVFSSISGGKQTSRRGGERFTRRYKGQNVERGEEG